MLVGPDGQTEQVGGDFLEKWFLVCFDHQSITRSSKLDLELLTEIAAILSLESCSEAEVIEGDGRMMVVPKVDSPEKFQFQSAILTDTQSQDILALENTANRQLSNVVVLQGSGDQLQGVFINCWTELHAEQPSELHAKQSSELHAEQPSELHAEQPSELHAEQPNELHAEQPSELHAEQPSTSELHAEQHSDICYYLLDPTGKPVTHFTGVSSAELVSKQISQLIMT